MSDQGPKSLALVVQDAMLECRRMQVPGEFFDDKKAHHAVTVVGLTKAGCQVAGEGPPVADGTPVNFFIGAIGPIPGKAEAGPGERMKISFLRPIDDLIVEHFEACC